MLLSACHFKRTIIFFCLYQNKCWPLCWKFPEGPPQACRRRGPWGKPFNTVLQHTLMGPKQVIWGPETSPDREILHIVTCSITLASPKLSPMDFPGHRTRSHSWRLTISRSTNSASPNELINPKLSMKNQPFSTYSFHWFGAPIFLAE